MYFKKLDLRLKLKDDYMKNPAKSLPVSVLMCESTDHI